MRVGVAVIATRRVAVGVRDKVGWAGRVPGGVALLTGVGVGGSMVCRIEIIGGNSGGPTALAWPMTKLAGIARALRGWPLPWMTCTVQ